MGLRFLFLCLVVSNQVICRAQDSLHQERTILQFSGSADLFYSHDFNSPKSYYRQPFFYSYNRHQEFTLNHGYIKVTLDETRYRANVALHAGTYVLDNYAEEPKLLRYIYELNAGLSLNKSGSLWLDAGIFPSHIGFESIPAFENETLTRSLPAEGSPYYLAGLQLSWKVLENLEGKVILCNGWQRIKRVRGNSLPAIGTQLYYSATKRVALNWSTFIGTDDPDMERRMRYFSNLYGIFSISTKLKITTGFDFGIQQTERHARTVDTWYSPVMIINFQLAERWSIASRVEYYQDKSGVIFNVAAQQPFALMGYSLSCTVKPIPFLLLRCETRALTSRYSLFLREEEWSKSNLFTTLSAAIQF